MMEERKQEIGAEPDQVFEIFLRPGELYWSNDSATRIRTLLGSCVAICLWHPRRKIGGMCHYLLPRRSDRAGAGPDPRYGDEAMELFLAEIGAATTRPSQYVAKVFGGGNMFEKINVSGSIGDGNVAGPGDAGSARDSHRGR